MSKLQLTRRQAAIIGAYTGILIGPFEDVIIYGAEKLGYDSETMSQIGMTMIADDLEKASKEDFLSLCSDEGQMWV